MKRVVMGMPLPEDYENPDIILGGCMITGLERDWNCLCEVIPNREVEFEITVSDITKLHVDAIVNAANPQLLAGGGVCGAIHRVAGPALENECLRKYPHGIFPGRAAVTKAYGLPAKMVVHAVAPRFFDTGPNGLETLVSAYKEALYEADVAGAKTVAIPSLGTGIYGWDINEVAAPVVLAIIEKLPELGNIEKVILCCYTEEDAAVYRGAL
jgi:O-acetyl-ADP-ribose deacetylase (regulator of RNase III)